MAAIREEWREPAKVRVAVGEGTFLVQQGLSQVIAALPGIEQVATCETAAQLERAVEAQAIDVVVTDAGTRPDEPDGGVALAVRLRETHPDIGVVILGQRVTPEHATCVFGSGSAGRAYLLRERIGSPDELEWAIRTVARGGSVTDPKLVEVLVAERMRAETSFLRQLTPREVEVLALMAEGRSNASIADALYLTKRAVEKHINSIFTKLDLGDNGDTDRRVSAALLFLGQHREMPQPVR
jgi:DNA-binding NarL/FixJ family response regulator